MFKIIFILKSKLNIPMKINFDLKTQKLEYFISVDDNISITLKNGIITIDNDINIEKNISEPKEGTNANYSTNLHIGYNDGTEKNISEPKEKTFRRNHDLFEGNKDYIDVIRRLIKLSENNELQLSSKQAKFNKEPPVKKEFLNNISNSDEFKEKFCTIDGQTLLNDILDKLTDDVKKKYFSDFMTKTNDKSNCPKE